MSSTFLELPFCHMKVKAFHGNDFCVYDCCIKVSVCSYYSFQILNYINITIKRKVVEHEKSVSFKKKKKNQFANSSLFQLPQDSNGHVKQLTIRFDIE